MLYVAKKHYLCGQCCARATREGRRSSERGPLGRTETTTNYKFFNYKTQTTNKMKKVYTQPSLIVEEVMVESGIAASPALSTISDAQEVFYDEF